MWGSNSTNDKGKKIEDFLNNNGLSLFNDGTNTYLHPGSGTYTAIDLSIADPSILNDFSWSVHEDLCGSDHFPLVLEPVLPSPEEHNPRWKFTKADWDTFSSLCREHIKYDLILDSDDPIKVFSDKLIDIAEEIIPKTSANPRIH